MATLQELVDSLRNAPTVIGATAPADPPALFDGLRRARIQYAEVTDSIANAQAVDAIVVDFGEQTEAAYWLAKIPAPLVDNTVVYFADRTASTITAAAIKTFANAAWKAQTEPASHANAGDIRNFRVDPVDGKTVQVTGIFNAIPATGAPTWTQQTWLLRLVDPNGSVTLGDPNIKFERVV